MRLLPHTERGAFRHQLVTMIWARMSGWTSQKYGKVPTEVNRNEKL